MRFSGSCVAASGDFLTDRRLASGAVAVVVTAAFAVALPLLTYSLSLALFGLAHVAAEMRYVGRRFGGRLQGGLLAGMVVLLSAVVVLRLAQQTGWWQGTDRLQTELAVVVGLAGLTLPALLRHAGIPFGIGVAITSVLALGLLVSPMGTALLLACLHNLTPVGFLAEALRGRERRAALGLAAVVFGAVPLLILSGIPATCLDAVGLHAPDVTVLPTGPLAAQLGAYLPRSLHEAAWASDAFSALVFAQCMHYTAVLHVLPGIAIRDAAPPEAPARQWIWRGLTLFIAAALLAGFLVDFKMARGWYGIFAAVHAWVEVPLLLLAMLPLAAFQDGTSFKTSSPVP
ncbi:MAG: hypothetical protein VX265_14155 [Myxococcota bacterium]|nr:hypothetical protein [Myxococcota bacterium]